MAGRDERPFAEHDARAQTVNRGGIGVAGRAVGEEQAHPADLASAERVGGSGVAVVQIADGAAGAIRPRDQGRALRRRIVVGVDVAVAVGDERPGAPDDRLT